MNTKEKARNRRRAIRILHRTVTKLKAELAQQKICPHYREYNTFYKTLCTGGIGAYSHMQWSLPHENEPGEWMPLINKIIERKSGYHFCRRKDLIKWLEIEIYEIEVRGKIYEYSDKCAVHEARLIRKLNTWTDRTARLFAADCAEHVLPLFENKQLYKAIETARQFAFGKISKEDLKATRNTIGTTYGTGNAVTAAVKATTGILAGDAARNAVQAAAEAAAGDAIKDIVGDAIRTTTRATAKNTERIWQTNRLFEYLKGERNES